MEKGLLFILMSPTAAADRQYSQYGGKVIATTERDATYVLDEALANETD